jgi:hypothetical protein
MENLQIKGLSHGRPKMKQLPSGITFMGMRNMTPRKAATGQIEWGVVEDDEAENSQIF